MQNFMCFFPRSNSCATTFGHLRPLLIFCNTENGVHGGEPMTKSGRFSAMIFLTLDWIFSLDRSQGFPVWGSALVRSKLQPGIKSTPSLLLAVASCATRGCEYSSTMSEPILLKMSRDPFTSTSTRMSVTLSSFLCRQSSGVSSMMHSSNIFQVFRHQMVLFAMSLMGGPEFVVVMSLSVFRIVLAKVPEPMSRHLKSDAAMFFLATIGPGCRITFFLLSLSSHRLTASNAVSVCPPASVLPSL